MNKMTKKHLLQNKWLQLILWSMVFLTSVLVYGAIVDFKYSIIRSFSNILLLVFLFYSNEFYTNYFLVKSKHTAYYTTVSITFGLVILLRVFLNNYLVAEYSNQDVASKQIVFIPLIFLTSLSTLFLSSLISLMVRTTQSEKENLKKINQLQRAQLDYLKHQINPHFLFNGLNNLYALVQTKSEKAPEMLMVLSNILRYGLYQSEEKQVDIEQEIEQIENYLYFFRIRRPGLEKQIVLNVESNTIKNHQLPPMLLIPLVENCFQHGDVFENHQGFIHVNIDIKDKQLKFEVKNSFNPEKRYKETGGIGLNNVKERLEVLFPKSHLFEVTNKGNQFLVNLEIEWKDLK